MANNEASRSDLLNMTGPIEPLSEPDLAISKSLDHFTYLAGRKHLPIAELKKAASLHHRFLPADPGDGRRVSEARLAAFPTP